MVYYGSEQYYGGGDDPFNREPLWTNMDREKRLYKMLATMNAVRKEMRIWSEPQVERYLDDDIFVFSRGKLTVAVTNRDSTQKRTVNFHPYADGTVLCNIFWATDCVTVTNGGFDVVLVGGEPKVFRPQQH
jgi:alpha-amylase